MQLSRANRAIALLSLLLCAAVTLVPQVVCEADGFDDSEEDAAAGEGADPLDDFNDQYGSPYGGGGGGYGGGDDYGGGYGGGGYGGGGYGGGGYGGGYGGGGAPPSTARELDSLEAVDAFIAENDVEASVVGYFDMSTNEDDAMIFQQLVAMDGKHYRFGVVTSKEVLEEKKYDGCAVITYLPPRFVSKEEKGKARFPGKTISSLTALKNHIRKKSLPQVAQMTKMGEKRYRYMQQPVLTVFTNVDLDRNAKGYNYVANRVRKVQKQLDSSVVTKDKVLFNIADIAEFSSDMSSKYEFTEPFEKGIFVGMRVDTVYYVMKEKFSVEAVQQFAQDVLEGKLEGKDQYDDYLNKEEEPSPSHPAAADEDGEEDPDKQVLTATADNFDDIVSNPQADVLVEFYAPWCGHCKALKPEFEAAAKNFRDDAGVTLAAFDATAHALPPGFAVEGYPTLFFIPASDKKNPVPYEGPRDAAGITAYLKKHRTSAEGNPLLNALDKDL